MSFLQCSQADLICLSLVSKHFRDLAAAHLYRNFHIVFPDDDDSTFDSPIDSLASGLETFVSSDYNYGRHLRELYLDTLSTGDKAELAYKPYLYTQSCGKFMNTLLLLTLRKATSLETFRWNIRVELSRPVYKTLHSISSLKNLHIRMQAGPSLFGAPPPLPFPSGAPTHHTVSTNHYWHGGPDLPMPSGSSVNYTSSLPPPIPSIAKTFGPKAKRKAGLDPEPPTISGFSKLRNLAILDIDDLDLVTDLKACIRNSSLSLNKLKLSFSTRLALQARKPKADIDIDDEDPEDEFAIVPLPAASSSWDDAAAPVKAFRAQEERKVQEAVLGRIFDLEPFVVKKAPKLAATTPSPKPKEPEIESTPLSPAKQFVDSLKTLSDELMQDHDVVLTLDPDSKAETLDLIRRAAEKYLQSDEAKKLLEKPDDKKDDKDETTTEAVAETVTPETAPATKTPVTSLKDIDKGSDPEDINVEEPMSLEEAEDIEAQSVTEQEAPVATETPPDKTPPQASKNKIPPDVLKASATLKVQKTNFANVLARLKQLEMEATALQNTLYDMQDSGAGSTDITGVERKVREYSYQIKSTQAELNTVRREILDAAQQAGVDVSKTEQEYARICEYIRSTRGIPLRTFSVCLIPVKASVLRNAIDLRVLRRLTLLNVGSQAGIWSMIAKENSKFPLPLRKIFTDHASPALLTCLAQLTEIEELFMIERSDSYKPESFAPKTNTTMEQIRRVVLKRHLPSMRKLMIKNDADAAWDADEKTVLMICLRGQKLEELAVSMGIRGMVSQHALFCSAFVDGATVY